jgi:hypothetical protein
MQKQFARDNALYFDKNIWRKLKKGKKWLGQRGEIINIVEFKEVKKMIKR